MPQHQHYFPPEKHRGDRNPKYHEGQQKVDGFQVKIQNICTPPQKSGQDFATSQVENVIMRRLC
jgi:hypothetical protein